MGVDTSTFRAILTAGFGHLWYALPIPRTDMHAIGQPRAGRRSLNAEGGLGLILHWLSSTMRQLSLQQIFALIPSTVSRYLRFALSILMKGFSGQNPSFLCFSPVITSDHWLTLVIKSDQTKNHLQVITRYRKWLPSLSITLCHFSSLFITLYHSYHFEFFSLTFHRSSLPITGP